MKVERKCANVGVQEMRKSGDQWMRWGTKDGKERKERNKLRGVGRGRGKGRKGGAEDLGKDFYHYTEVWDQRSVLAKTHKCLY